MATDIEVIVDPASIVTSVTLATGAPGPKGDRGDNGSDASVTLANITSALGYTPDSPTATRPPSAHTHPLSQIQQSSASSGQVPTWNGSAWVPSTPASSSFTGNTDAVPEGSTNLYFTAARAVSALASTLTGYATQAWVTAQGYITSASLTWGNITGKPTFGSAAEYAAGDFVQPYDNSALTSLVWGDDGISQLNNDGTISLKTFSGSLPSNRVGTLIAKGSSLNYVSSSGIKDLTSPSWLDISPKPSNFSPSAHASSHASGGSDALTLAASQITGLGTAATQNSTAFDAAGAATTAQTYAIQRANHTGTQAASTITGLAAIATSGSYTDLSNKPTIPAAQVNSDWNSTSGVSQILNKPTLFSGAYSALTGIPSTFAPSAHTHAATDVTGLSAVATSGSAADLSTGTLPNARLSSTVSLDNIDNAFTAGQSITAAANTSALTASYSVTGANTTPLLDLSGTWNTTGIARGILLNITDTASAGTSKLFELGTTTSGSYTQRFRVDKFGAVLAANNIVASAALQCAAANGVSWGGQAFIYSPAANALEQRNGTSANTLRVYNSFSDSANYERGVFDWTTNANTLTIGTQAAGTGTARRLRLNSAEQIDVYCLSTTRMFQFSTSGNTSFGTFTWTYYSAASDPTTATVPFNNGSGYCALYRNTTSGVVKLWCNNNGTMVSVVLV